MAFAASTQPPSNPERALVRVRGLSKRFPAERDLLGRTTKWLSAVNNVDLDIYPGETLGLIGESGSTSAKRRMTLPVRQSTNSRPRPGSMTDWPSGENTVPKKEGGSAVVA